MLNHYIFMNLEDTRNQLKPNVIFQFWYLNKYKQEILIKELLKLMNNQNVFSELLKQQSHYL